MILDIVLAVGYFSIVGFIIWNQQNTIKELNNRIMARNYGELVQAEVYKKTVDANTGLDVKVREPDNEPAEVDVLNQIL